MDPHQLLRHATLIVAKDHAGPRCVEASAMLVEVGQHLGYNLQARPVSMFATTGTPEQNVATGEFGRAFAENYLARRTASVTTYEKTNEGTDFERRAGHMIVVSTEHELLLDPTFAQFHYGLGEQMPLFASKVRLRAGRYWQVSSDDLLVRYFAVDEPLGLKLDELRTEAGPRAEQIAAHLRSPDQPDQTTTWGSAQRPQ